MALKIIDHGTSDYRQMVELRLHLLRKPLGLSFTAEELEKEKSDILLPKILHVTESIPD